MASIADRWHTIDRQTRRKVRSARYGRGKRWQVRYRDPDGESRNRSFDRKVDAECFLVELQHRLNRGGYVDERAGRVEFREYAHEWLSRQVLASPSREALELRLRVHMQPAWGSWPLSKITPAAVQRWVRAMSEDLSPGYIKLILTSFGAILGSAVAENLIATNPARSSLVRVPPSTPRRVRPWPIDRVLEVIERVPAEHQALVTVAAGCGLRQGEAFGVRVQDLDFLRRELHVRQQIRLERGRPLPAFPKYGRTRVVPMPAWVALELARRLERVPPLPGDRLEAPALGGLLFYSREHKPLNRNYFNQSVWRPALRAAGVSNERDNGMHALRHACASLWLEQGVSIKAVSEYLGHADPGFTLRVYTHVMPTSGDKARTADAPWAHATVREGGN